jgi:hypothetical protein
MASAEIAKRIEAPADRVWAILAGRDMIELITGLYGEQVEYEGLGKGAVLTTTLKDGRGVIKERIEHLDDDERCLKYRVIDVGPFPYANYLGEIRVTLSGPNACNVSFQSTYVPVGMSEENSTAVWLETNRNMLERLNEYVSSKPA